MRTPVWRIPVLSAASKDTFCTPRSQSLEAHSAPWPLLSAGALSSLTTTRMLRIRIDETPGRLLTVW